MNDLFHPERYKDFTLFSTEHLLMIGLLFVVGLVLVFSRDAIRKRPTVQQYIRWGFFTILLVGNVGYQAWSIWHAVWDARINLPFQLCSISSLVVLFFLLKPTESRFQIVYFIALIPPSLAVLTPDLLYGSPHYRFFQFFIFHITLVATVLYYLIVDKYEPRFVSVLKAFVFINILAVPLGFLNNYLGSNYLFLEGPPAADTLLSLFGSGYWYLINLEIVMLLTFFLTYLPFYLKRKFL
ncbi:YwaF family protein [Pseudalkalibacillus sp. Hm43]|uniref:YwaF family protein n=1 Tax=Pseudalkalibacillus sp. Hm43 TaxID=3450742 RepID=UPI003F442904